MKKIKRVLLATTAVLSLAACQEAKKTDWITHALDVSAYQLESVAQELTDTNLLPRSSWTYHDDGFLVEQLGHMVVKSDDPLEVYSVRDLQGQRRECPISDWTSGFFPGSLWYAYELTGNEELKKQAVRTPICSILFVCWKATHEFGIYD